MQFVRKLRRRLLHLEIWLGLAWSRFLIKHVPFRRWRSVLGPIDGERAECNWPEFSAAQKKQAADVGRIVDRVANRLRLFEAVCLPRAMVARWVLARRGIPSRIVIGSRRGEAGKDDKDLLFHAWLMVGDIVVTGQDERADFLEFSKRGASTNGA